MTATLAPRPTGAAAHVEPARANGQPIPQGDANAAKPKLSEELRRRLRKRRMLVVVALMVVAALAAFDMWAERVMYSYRQQHLAASIDEPKADLAEGDAYGILQAPDIELNVVVAEGIAPSVMRGGPGRVPRTAEPGQKDDLVIAGHRTRYGAPFKKLDALENDSEIVLKARNGTIRAYKVTDVRKPGRDDPLVEPDDTGGDSERDAESGEERLVLVTAGSGWVPQDRVVVVADAKEKQPEPSLATEQQDPIDVTPDQLDHLVVDGWKAFGVLLMLVLAMVGVGVSAGPLKRRLGSTGAAAVLVPVCLLIAVVSVLAVDLVVPMTV